MLTKLSICVTFLLAVNTINLVLAKSKPAPELDFELPEGIPTCADDDNINKCLQNSFNEMLSTGAKGIPEVNIPSIDPSLIDRLDVQFDNNLIRGRVVARNVRISGLFTKTIKKLEYERQGKQIKLMLHYRIPKLQIEGKYKGDVQFLNAANGTPKGLFDISLLGVETQSEYFAELYERDGHLFMKITKVNLKSIPREIHIAGTGLSADPIFHESLLQILNDNWRALYDSVIATNKRMWEPLILQYANDFFSHVPFDLFVTNPKI